MNAYIHNIGLSYDANRPFDEEIVAKGINLERAKIIPIFSQRI